MWLCPPPQEDTEHIGRYPEKPLLMYIIYMINSIVGWVKWEKDLKLSH